MITIVDYGMGNIGSMLNMFKRIGCSANSTSDVEKLLRAEKLVLPGVGAFDSALYQIEKISGLREVLDQKALKEQIPILGVCLGMQLLTSCSEEGKLPGLGWIRGSAVKFPNFEDLKIPHMGWNITKLTKTNELTRNIELLSRYYFVHSYYVKVRDPNHSLMQTHYGVDFDAAISRDNIFGVQFHPEKSHRFGMKILQNFSELK